MPLSVKKSVICQNCVWALQVLGEGVVVDERKRDGEGGRNTKTTKL